MVSREDLLFLRFCVAVLRLENAALTAVFTPVLLTATAIMTIFDNLLTAAMAASIYNNFCNHIGSLPLIT